MCAHVLAVGAKLGLADCDLATLCEEIRERRRPGRPQKKKGALQKDDIPQYDDIVLARAPATAEEEAAAVQAEADLALEVQSGLPEEEEEEDVSNEEGGAGDLRRSGYSKACFVTLSGSPHGRNA